MRTEMLSTLLTQMTESGHVEVQGNEHTSVTLQRHYSDAIVTIQ